MRPLLPLVLLVVVVVLGACGGTDNPTIDARPGAGNVDAAIQKDAAVAGNCMMTLSGVLTGTFSCTATAGKNDDDSSSIVGMFSTGGGAISSLAFNAQIPGTIAVRDYTIAELDQVAATVTTDNNIYEASRGSEDDKGSIGPLHITGLELQPPTAGAMVWIPHGSVSATLIGTTTSGTVMMEITF